MTRSPIERALGTGGILRLRGKMYQCSPLRLAHFAEAKAFLVALAPDPLAELAAEQSTFNQFPPEVQKALALKALEIREERKSTTSAEAHLWINSEEGILFLFWCMVRDHHKELATFQAVVEAFKPGDKHKELSIPECDLIRQKLDLLTLGGEVDAMKKKAPAAKPKPPRRKKKR